MVFCILVEVISDPWISRLLRSILSMKVYFHFSSARSDHDKSFNMKRTTTLFLFSLFLLTSCGSYYSMNSFYNDHKNDSNVTAVRVPQFMFAVLSGLSPEMNGLMGTVNDLRYIRLEKNSGYRMQLIDQEVNQILDQGFIEAFRKNKEDAKTVYAVKEKGPVVHEVVTYTNNGTDVSVLYLKGNFDGNKVREMMQGNDFESLTNALNAEYKLSPLTSGIIN